MPENPDFKAACDRFARLFFFPSLPALTELLVGDGSAIDTARDLVLANVEQLESAIVEEASSLSFYHSDSKFGEIDDVDIKGASVDEVRIVGLGDRDCTVAFEAVVELRVNLRWGCHCAAREG